MAKKMTIFDALEAFELYELYENIIDAYEADFYAQSEMNDDLRDLIEEHEEIYEFSEEDNGDYTEACLLSRPRRYANGHIYRICVHWRALMAT